jgi:hypothetical protein
LAYYQDFVTQHGEDPQLQADVAAAHIRAAAIGYLNEEPSDQWFPHLRDAVDIAERLIEEHRDTPEVQKRLGRISQTVGDTGKPTGGSVSNEEQNRYLRKQTVILEKIVRDNPGVAEFEGDLAGAYFYLSSANFGRSEGVS